MGANRKWLLHPLTILFGIVVLTAILWLSIFNYMEFGDYQHGWPTVYWSQLFVFVAIAITWFGAFELIETIVRRIIQR